MNRAPYLEKENSYFNIVKERTIKEKRLKDYFEIFNNLSLESKKRPQIEEKIFFLKQEIKEMNKRCVFFKLELMFLEKTRYLSKRDKSFLNIALDLMKGVKSDSDLLAFLNHEIEYYGLNKEDVIYYICSYILKQFAVNMYVYNTSLGSDKNLKINAFLERLMEYKNSKESSYILSHEFFHHINNTFSSFEKKQGDLDINEKRIVLISCLLKMFKPNLFIEKYDELVNDIIYSNSNDFMRINDESKINSEKSLKEFTAKGLLLLDYFALLIK